MEKDIIFIPPFKIRWGCWVPWCHLNDFVKKPRNKPGKIPDQPGVYEAKYIYSEERLHIGFTEKGLRKRIQEMLKGKKDHSAGKRMADAGVDFKKVVVRWAVTRRPEAIEKALMIRHLSKFDRIPIFDTEM